MLAMFLGQNDENRASLVLSRALSFSQLPIKHNQHQHRHYPDDQPDDAGLLWRDLRVLDQLGQVLLADTVLRLDVEQDDPEQCFF